MEWNGMAPTHRWWGSSRAQSRARCLAATRGGGGMGAMPPLRVQVRAVVGGRWHQGFCCSLDRGQKVLFLFLLFSSLP